MNGMIATEQSAFSPRVVLGMVLFGALVFVLMLWMMGAGYATGQTNDGGNHAGGKGLTGYAALAALLEKDGHTVRLSRSEAVLDDPGLLVLTPDHFDDGDEISAIIEKRRYAGPTILILPKWNAAPAPSSLYPDARKGWVMLGEASEPTWSEDTQTPGPLVARVGAVSGGNARWLGYGRTGTFPDPGQVQTISSNRITALLRSGENRVLAGYLADEGWYPELADAAQADAGEGEDDDIWPVLVVAEPDLLNNYGFGSQERAMLALDLVESAMEGEDLAINFDLTLNGLGRTTNLLTLAFSPPFLAATLCLIMAMVAVGWRAFLRFGPAARTTRAIAFGKRALVSNAAGLIRRSKRLHLVGAPYADHARERIARMLALPRQADAEATEKAIDRALLARMPGAQPFTRIAARLRAARREADIVRAAQDLHSLERTLKR